MADAIQKPLLYILLGATGSGRRELLADWLEETADQANETLVLLAAEEPASPHDVKLGRVSRWQWMDREIVPFGAETVPAMKRIFWLADGRGNPVDQLEVLKAWIKASGLELARIYCVVNCQLAEKHPALLQWYDACVHFSDVTLLAKREGVANKWMSDFKGRYENQHIPCLFELVKQGRVKNPAMILHPEARRMSQYFDENAWDDIDLEGVEIGVDDEEEPLDEAALKEAEEDGEGPPPKDIYFELRAGGRRVIELPDIRKYLEE